MKRLLIESQNLSVLHRLCIQCNGDRKVYYPIEEYDGTIHLIEEPCPNEDMHKEIDWVATPPKRTRRKRNESGELV
jgi:hypothetical protein